MSERNEKLSKVRVLVLIDGFNYYHKLKSYQSNNRVCVKWLNYKNLMAEAVKGYRRYEDFDMSIYYFSAIATHRSKEACERHRNYIKALEHSGVNVVLGEFKEKYISPCNDCKQKLPQEEILKHEEKHTDVNIAISLLEKAFMNEFDDAYLLSEDNDYVPAVKRVKELYPHKSITICPPPQKMYFVDALVKASGERDAYRLKWNQIRRHQFPDYYQGLVNPWREGD